MIRTELAVAAIALIATGAVASAQAQTQTASVEPTIGTTTGQLSIWSRMASLGNSIIKSLVQGCWK
jgi:hypothetical protein